MIPASGLALAGLLALVIWPDVYPAPVLELIQAMVIGLFSHARGAAACKLISLTYLFRQLDPEKTALIALQRRFHHLTFQLPAENCFP